MTNSDLIAIIPAAGRPTNRVMMNSNLPDAMIPINGKPVISYIIEDLIGRGIDRIVVILNKDDQSTERYISKRFGTKSKLTIVYDHVSRGVGHSIYLAKPYIKKMDRVLVYLGDTIYKGKLKLDNDFLVVSSKYETPQKWCFVEKSKKGIKFINKPAEYKGRGKILSGLYFFKDGERFAKAMSTAEKKNNIIELSHILSEYSKYHNFKLIEADRWYDCGNIENFHKAKIDFLKVRSFNSIQYDDLKGHITKSSKDKEKISHEVNWFKNVPDNLKIFTPRLVGYTVGNKTSSYSLEFYGYQSLADFFLLGSLDIKIWPIIINKLFKIIDLFRAHKTKIPYSQYYGIYYTKTISRLDILAKNKDWKDILNQEIIKINGLEYKNINHFKPRLAKAVTKLYSKKEMCFMHGDLCLSNILFDPISRVFKFIDPRGSFGKASIHGDIKYDVAKLRHSFSGLYDFIVSDHFELKEASKYDYVFNNHIEEYHKTIAGYFDVELKNRKYDLEKIKLIEALLFLSMVPLHQDSPTRQKAMYLTGIKLINESRLLDG